MKKAGSRRKAKEAHLGFIRRGEPVHFDPGCLPLPERFIVGSRGVEAVQLGFLRLCVDKTLPCRHDTIPELRRIDHTAKS